MSMNDEYEIGKSSKLTTLLIYRLDRDILDAHSAVFDVEGLRDLLIQKCENKAEMKNIIIKWAEKVGFF